MCEINRLIDEYVDQAVNDKLDDAVEEAVSDKFNEIEGDVETLVDDKIDEFRTELDDIRAAMLKASKILNERLLAIEDDLRKAKVNIDTIMHDGDDAQ